MKIDVIALEKSKEFSFDNARHTVTMTVTKDVENSLSRMTVRTAIEQGDEYEVFPPVSWIRPLKSGEDFEAHANEMLGQLDEIIEKAIERGFGESYGEEN